MGRYFLDQLPNYRPTNTLTKTDPGVPDPREPFWQEEREKYGFDSRDTWSLYTTMTELLYERLKKFIDNAEPVIVIPAERREIIDRMIHLAETFLLNQAEEEELDAASSELWALWAEHHQSMWW